MKFNYGKQYIDQADIDSVVKVMKSDFLTQGPKIKDFEDAICEYTGAKYCIAVSSGTAALHTAVAALDLKPGVSGITSPLSFVASANCMLYNYITPEFCDIDIETGLMDLESLNSVLTSDTKLVIPVHFTGRVVDIKKLRATVGIDVFIIEDAAHAIGSQYTDRSYVGSCKYSDMTIFSFHPVKTITTGEGGCITTNDSSLYNKMLELRNHGITKNKEKYTVDPGPWYYEMQGLGFNYRITDMQAALGISQLSKLEVFKKKRLKIVDYYNSILKKENKIKVLSEDNSELYCYHLYVVLIEFNKRGISRKEVMQKLKDKGIGTQVHYIPIPEQPFYKLNHDNVSKIPNANQFYQKCLSLPLYYNLELEDVDYICSSLSEVLSV